jgi:hypothetical protein
VKDSNPRHAQHHLWPAQSQIFEPTTMHYTDIDEPEKTKIRTQDHAHTTIYNLHWHFNGVHGYWWRHCTHKPKAHINPKFIRMDNSTTTFAGGGGSGGPPQKILKS